MLISMIQKIMGRLNNKRTKEQEKITISNTADHYIMDQSQSMMDRMGKAINAWEEHNRQWEYVLLDEEVFFAAQCWVFTHNYFDLKSSSYDPDIAAYLEKSRQAIGGDDGWDRILAQRVGCNDCGETWKRENIKYCVCCMNYVCMDCQEKHERVCKESLVG